jgi:hypothetical protein
MKFQNSLFLKKIIFSQSLVLVSFGCQTALPKARIITSSFLFYLHRKMQVMGLLKNNSLHKNEYFHYISWFTTSQRI